MKEEVLVSVIMITYQHAEFIRQDIQSVLDQKSNVKFELLLGEDMSTDGTREICQEMAASNPEKIRLVLHDRSQMILIKGKPSGRRNFIELFKMARGKYIALCPGDDMWTDETKLQQLVDVLEQDPEVSICFHNALDVHEDGHEVDYVRTWLKKDRIPPIFELEDIIATNFIPSSGCMFRRSTFSELPEAFYTAPALDWYMHVTGAMKGKIAYIDKVMSIRRIHDRGIISNKPRLTKIDWNLDMLEIVDELTHHEFHGKVNARKRELLRIALDLALHSDPKLAKPILARMASVDDQVINFREKVKALIMVYMPSLSKAIYKLRAGNTA